MKEQIMNYIRNITLIVLERLDARDTAFKRLAYKITRKIHDKVFFAIFGVSAYDYSYWGEYEND